MKVNLKNILGVAALGMTLLANTVPTWAGEVYTPGVYVSCGTQACTVQGTMVGTRYSADSKQYIGCELSASRNGSSYITCYAMNSAGKYAICSSTDPGYVEQTQRMTDSSLISFVADRATYACTDLYIADYSSYLK